MPWSLIAIRVARTSPSSSHGDRSPDAPAAVHPSHLGTISERCPAVRKRALSVDL